ncbi:hypothetical protein Calag_1516 [Caldisphaera lagunensis DSM 15908]|uniref:DUF5518 domain-containing protein n=1 Tax=Caldisphaera lagunensis (strain DSM 15908 / JCM 11604 / ANMR 0165 / IC-154) TaxID=1056495 RepID=L0ABH9_CALLD|nr:hypothetical protein [Caldisphaera lagunensis]AFZ71216.1 hypothetical protein Calag_1516 [Caldisphaera lagunensis DSM 15908]
MRKINIAIILIGIILTLIFSYFIPYVWGGIIPGAIIGVIKRRSTKLISSFLIGFIGSLVVYFVYPINYLISLAKTVELLAGIQWFILILLFPLLYGLIELSAAGIVGEILSLISKK